MKKQSIKKLTVWFLSWRLILFLIAALAPRVIDWKPSFPYAYSLLAISGLPQWIYSWANFDGVHYLTIVQKGYLGTGLIQAFFPLYPLLVRVADLIITQPIISGLVVSNFFAWTTMVLFYKLVKIDHSHQKASLAVISLITFPTAWFLGAYYNESFFLSLVLGSFLLARKKQWLASGILVALASATRVVAVALIPALLLELWLQQSAQKKFSFDRLRQLIIDYYPICLKILLGLGGLVAYMVYLKFVFKDPLYFFHVQSEFGAGRQESIILFPQVIWRYLKILVTTRPFDWKYFSYAQDLVVALLGLGGLIWSWFRVRRSYVIFGLLAFLLPSLTGTFSSMPRYVLVSFPLFILIAQLIASKRRHQVFYFLISGLLFIINLVLFIQGYWVA